MLAACGGKHQSGMPPAMVETAPVSQMGWQTTIDAIGTLNANQGVIIKPEISGRITGIYFRSGQDIKAGAPLAQVNPDILAAQLAEAKAKLILSKANYERALLLFKKRVMAQADLDNSLSAYQVDQASVNNMQAQLNETLITAPFNGRLGLRMVDQGDFVNVGDTITTLNSIDPLRVDFSVPEVYLGNITIGNKVLIHSSSYPDQTFTGIIYAMDSQINPNTRSLGVRATLPNTKHILLPGGFVDIIIQTGAPAKVLTVPETAVYYSDTGPYVYRVVKNMAVKTMVKLGQHKDDVFVVTDGLNAKDVIITVGGFKVSDGAPIMSSTTK